MNDERTRRIRAHGRCLRLFLKLENFQAIGAFKVRAAFTVVDALNAQQRAGGIVFTSSGNFAQAFALAGRHYGVRACAVMLASVSPYKIHATQALGGEVDLFEGHFSARQARVEAIARERGMTAINAREARPIVVGNGSLGLEILEQMRDVEQILVPVSSGGMAAGLAVAVKHIAPHVRVIGVQPAGANAAYQSLAAGKVISLDRWSTIADGLSSPCPGAYPFAHLQRYLDGIVLVEEHEIAQAHMMLRRRAKVIAEPAGAVCVAAFMSKRIDTHLRTAAVISGGNLTEDTMRTLEKMSEVGT